MHILINKKYLTFKNYKVKCALGKRGIGSKRKEGDLITPKGEYKIRYVLYRKDRIKKMPTKLKKIIIRKNSGWCDDSSSKDYNKFHKQLLSPINKKVSPGLSAMSISDMTKIPRATVIRKCKFLLKNNYVETNEKNNIFYQ